MGNDCNLCHKDGLTINLELIPSQIEQPRSLPERVASQKRSQQTGVPSKQTSPVTTGTSNKSIASDDSNYIKNYEIMRQIGAGGFGKVYEVRNSKNQKLALKTVAIPKDCPPSLISSEAKSMIKAQHPSIIKVQEFFFWNDDAQLIIVVQFGSHDLRSMIKSFKTMESIKILDYMLQMAQGIDHLHQINIIHRDLKPENILIVDDKIKITDFGLAKVFQKDMALKTQAGTPMYLAPQILSGASYSEKVDIWSLGVIFLELVTAKNIPEHSQGSMYPALNQYFPNKPLLEIYDTDMRSLIAKMLEKDPQKRINMKTVIKDLQRIHDNEQIFPGIQQVQALIKRNKSSEAVELLLKSWDGKTSIQPLVKKLRKQNRQDQIASFALEVWKKNPEIVYNNFQFDRHEKVQKMKLGKSTDGKIWLFIGQTAFGKMNGKGKTVWSDGQSYEGDYKADKQNGVGVYYFKNGDKYSGTWCNDQITGKGTYYHVDGDWYEGDHLKGLRHGFGTYHYKERGDKYSGRWQNGKKHGKGIYTWKDGKKCEGEYSDDIIEGEEIMTGRSHKTASESNSMVYKKRKMSMAHNETKN